MKRLTLFLAATLLPVSLWAITPPHPEESASEQANIDRIYEAFTFHVHDGVRSQRLGAVPVGGVTLWTTSTAPAGWVLCDGSTISRTGYSKLYGVIGTTYGTGDGSTTFNGLLGSEASSSSVTVNFSSRINSRAM